MSSLSLFAETPRAGEHGHRFLVAEDAHLPESQIAEFLKTADADNMEVSWGTNFVGVGRPVQQVIGRSVQQASGTAVRVGREIIILAGVDVDQLSDPDRDHLQALLRERLEYLEKLVIHEIDWSRHRGTGLVVPSRELSQWLNEIQVLGLPTTEWQRGPRTSGSADRVLTPTAKRGMWARSVVLGLALFISVIAILFVVAKSPLEMPPGNAVTSPGDQVQEADSGHSPSPLDYEQKVNELKEEWKCEPADVVRSLLRAANWDRRNEADDLTLQAGLQDGEVRSILEKVTSIEGVERLLVSDAIKREGDFRKFVQDKASLTDEESLRLREWLYEAWDNWNRLHEAGEGAVSSLADEDDMTKLMFKVAEITTDEGFGEEFRKPVTPLFERQDEMIWNHLNECRKEMESEGPDVFRARPVEHRPLSELASFLVWFGKEENGGEIVAQSAKSHFKMANRIPEKEGNSSVDSTFNAFQVFLRELGTFKHP